MIKSLALNLLLALGSVAAASQPRADEGGLSARYPAPVTCGNLATPDRGSCKCTDNDAVLNAAKTACSCKSGFKQVGNECVRDCGSDAEWKGSFFTGYECKCKTSYLSYTASTKSCACSKSYQEDRGGKCQDICPGAVYHPSGVPEKCVCPQTSRKFDFTDKKCVNKCPADITNFKASENEAGFVCECKSPDKKFANNNCNTPKCPVSGSKYKSDDAQGKPVCECEDKSKKLVDDACVPKCPKKDETFSKDGDNGPVCVKKCPEEGTEFDKDGPNDTAICKCVKDSEKLGSDGKCSPKCTKPEEKWTEDTAEGSPVCKPKCPEKGTRFVKDGDKETDPAVCECIEDSEKLNSNGQCEPKCDKAEEKWTEDTAEGPVCKSKCPEKGTAFVKDGEKKSDPPVCKCIADEEKLDSDGKCVLKCDKPEEKWTEDDNDGQPICVKKCPKADQQFVKDGEKKTDPPVCECVAKSEKLDDGDCKPKCAKPSEKWTEDDNNGNAVCVKKCDKEDEKWTGDSDDDDKTPICEPKCPKTGQKWVSDGEKEDDPPICGCVKASEKLYDGECTPKCPIDHTVFVKDGEDGEPPVCECDDEKNYLTEDGCKPKCPADATYKKNGDDWTCDCPNTGEVFTKADSDSDPKCACDSDEKHVKDGKCVSKCPAGATYHAQTSGYTCDCSTAIAGSDWDKDNNSCGCPAKNADNEKLILNDAKDKCVLDCGSEAKLSTSGDKCECKTTYGTKFDKNLRQCPCDAPEFKPSNGVCVPDCGTQATLNRARTSCVCKKSGQKFTMGDKSCACDSPLVWSDGCCHMACGKYANWDKSRKECVCQKRGQLFNDASATCACPGKKIWDGSQCIPDCGNYATWNGRNKACICDKKGQVFTPSTSTCDCPEGEKWIGNKCTVDCGDEAQLDRRTGKCACYKTGQTFDKVTLGCACPASAPEWSSKAKKCFKPKA